jgi:hypothetical protein
MARLPNQPQMGQDMMDLMGLAQISQSMGLNQPPEIGNLLKLLSIADEMQNREQDIALKRQALENERQKQAQMSPEMFTALMFNQQLANNPQAQQNLVQKVAPGILPPAEQVQEQPAQKLAELGKKPDTRVKKSRMDVKSAKPYLGYTPPPGSEGVQAVLDENNNIINFVRTGTTEPVADFVPSSENVGLWPSYKYAVAQRMGAMGRALGLAPGPQKIQPY